MCVPRTPSPQSVSRHLVSIPTASSRAASRTASALCRRASCNRLPPPRSRRRALDPAIGVSHAVTALAEVADAPARRLAGGGVNSLGVDAACASKPLVWAQPTQSSITNPVRHAWKWWVRAMQSNRSRGKKPRLPVAQPLLKGANPPIV